MSVADRWNNRYPTAWEGKIPGEDRLFRAVRVDDKTVIAQVLSGEKWLNVGEAGGDEGIADLIMEQAVSDLCSRRKYQVYCYDRSPAFLAQIREFGLENDAIVELTAGQVVELSQRVAVMVTPAPPGDVQLLRVDTPRWCFKQR